MRVYRKYCYESKIYGECVEVTAACASENNCDYLIESNFFDIGDLNEVVYYGFLLKGE